MLKCCLNGGCWKSRVSKIGDGAEQDNSICERPVETEGGIIIPQCLAMITVDDVVRAVKEYEYL
jgi:hypothetical protein